MICSDAPRRLAPWLALLVALAIAMPATAKAVLYGQGLLWRVQGHGAAPSYLFGTMHSSDERVLQIPKPVLDAFDASDRFVFELIIPQQQTGKLDRTPRLRLPAAVELRQIVGEEVYAKIVGRATRYGIPQASIDRVHPLAFVFVFRKTPHEYRRQLQGWAFLDQALQNEARALGKPVYALETIEEQLLGFKSLGRKDIGTMLNAIIDRSFRAERAHETLLQSYLRRDLDAIFTGMDLEASRLSGEERHGHDLFMSWLLDYRNHVMATRVVQHLRAGKAFVAVGAAHLPGQMGLLHLLERQGYRVKRLY
ncbi:MAG: TraB/GumN family protein [Alphaproteobacteria bacterium]|jgi:hypothetical protein|nr:TraB/GumN family protein [Alphaproteobacteria bacterium]